MAVRKAGVRKSKQTARRSDGLSTTPTQYGDTSPDYVRQEGDPDYLRSYSEEQIGMLGGRESIFQRVASREQRAADQAATLEVDVPAPSEGSTTPPTTYGGVGEGGTPGILGEGEMPKPGKQGGNSLPGKPALTGTANAITRGKGKKKGLYKRIAKTTGSTTAEGQGIMKKARKQIRAGNKAGAKRTITRALSGGPKAGVPRSPQRSAKAAKAATKITKRIATRQAQAIPKRRKK